MYEDTHARRHAGPCRDTDRELRSHDLRRPKANSSARTSQNMGSGEGSRRRRPEKVEDGRRDGRPEERRQHWWSKDGNLTGNARTKTSGATPTRPTNTATTTTTALLFARRHREMERRRLCAEVVVCADIIRCTHVD